MSNNPWKVGWVLTLAILHFRPSSAACPPPPVQCVSHSQNCYLTNYRGEWEDRMSCKVAKAFFPKTEAELIHAVAYAVKEGRKIKVITGSSHSRNRLVCPGGDSGVVISTRDYNSRITVKKESMTVTVDAGVELRKLIDTLAEKDLAFAHAIDWDGASVAGVISTAAHGSGLWGKGSGIHEYVVGMSLVVPAPAHHGYAKLIHLTEEDEALKAARVSLGVLGAISRVTLAVEKIFKRSVTLKVKNDSDLEKFFLGFAESHEFGLVNWYPSLHRVVYTVTDRVPVEVPGNGTLSNFPPVTVQSVLQSRATQEVIYARRDAIKLCKLSKAAVEQSLQRGFGYLSDGVAFKGFPVVGYNHLMQTSSGCQDRYNKRCRWRGKELRSNDTICAWDTQVKGPTSFHTAIAIPLSRIAEAIRDIKRLRNLNPSSLCAIEYYNGFNMRYVKASEDYLGHGEDSVDFQFFYFRHRDPGVPRWNEDVMEEVEQMLLHKYGGVPHWGKNRVYTFQGAAKRRVNLRKFLKVKKEMDPKEFFSSEWSDGVLGIGKGVEIWRDGCALDGLCECKEDRHCAPEKGSYCRGGRVWNKARICSQQ